MRLVVVQEQPHRLDGPWSGPDATRHMISVLLGVPPRAVRLLAGLDAAAEALAEHDVHGVLWLPAGAMPTEGCRRMLLSEHGVGVWSTADRVRGGPVAVSLGSTAVRAWRACRAGGCAGPAGTGIDAVAFHLVRRHQVALAGPRPGLVSWGPGRSRLILGGKDVALARLAGLMSTAHIDPGVVVDDTTWSARPVEVLGELRAVFGERAVIVRSCAAGEDGWEASHAGAYASIPVPAGAGEPALAEAIRNVFASYPDDAAGRVLIQHLVQNVQAAAVVTTRTLSGSPYMTATLDTVSGRTDLVTSGTAAGLETWYWWRGPGGDAAPPGTTVPPALTRILATAAEAAVVSGEPALDVELAVAGGVTHLLQARPIAHAARGDDDAAARAFATAQHAVAALADGPDPRLLGAGLVLSNMADWNPAEMIGRAPRALAMSLYQTLITDAAWAQARHGAGYRDLRGVPLMHTVGGSGYIDVRASLASFIPAGIEDALAVAIVRAQAERLRADPAAHDKVEFEIAATCWTPRLAARTGWLAGHGIGTPARMRLHTALAELTRAAIRALPDDAAAMERIAAPSRAQAADLACCLRRAAEAALVFARLARTAFIATDLLRALAEEGLADHLASWLIALGTPAEQLRGDGAAVADGCLDWEAFVERYRWMRPGTYEVTVPAYGADPDGYLRPLLQQAHPSAGGGAASPFTDGAATRVERAVAVLGLDAGQLQRFARAALTGREAGKARYAAWVSAVLEAAAARGEAMGLSRGEVADLPIDTLLHTPAQDWPGIAARHQELRAAAVRLELPDVITSPGDLRLFCRRDGRPNFIGAERATGPVHADPSPADPPPAGAVIVVEAADPGMDWVLAHRPAALVTAYGGANSHMAIRCAELGLTAAIGIGTTRLAAAAAARRITVDPVAGRVDLQP